MHRPADLREILHYVPRYRDKLFVVAVDGCIVAHDNFRNLLLDIAVLDSLRIGVVLIHGAAYQIQLAAEAAGKRASDLDGSGVTDAWTLDLAISAANRVTQEILEGLASLEMRGAYSNAVLAHPAGILAGVDYQFTGRVERVDTQLLRTLLNYRVVPVVPPLGIDREGQTYRLNSDAVAAEVAGALAAVKLIYLTDAPGISIRESDGSTKLLRQLPVEEAERLFHEEIRNVAPEMRSKLEFALRACSRGVPRVHVVDGRIEEGLLAEVFSHDGVGTLIHNNEYQAIRPASRRDARAVYSLIQLAAQNDELVPRTLQEIEQQIGDFFVFEVDRLPVGVVALHRYPEDNVAELACLCVHPHHENQGIGRRLTSYVIEQAKRRGARRLFCLSTQAYKFFQQKAGFQPGSPEDLPAERRKRYEDSGRRSVVLVRDLLQSL